MKKRINTANEQSLTQKNQASANVRRANTAQKPASEGQPMNRTRPSPMRNIQNAQDGQNVRGTQNMQNVRPVQHRTAQTGMNPPAQQNIRAAQMNRRPEAVSSQNRPAANQVSSAAQNQAVNRTDITGAHQNANRSVQPVQRDGRSSPQALVRAETPQKPVQKKPVTEPSVPVNKVPAPVNKAPAPTNKAPASVRESRAQMMKTKTTDVAPFGQEQKKVRTEKVSSDEGGNTVVSVVKAIVYIIFVIIISVFLALCIINIGNDMFSFVKSDEIVEVEIPEYATLDEVANILYMNDIIRYPTIFKLYAVAKKSDTDFLAGTYPVNGMMNYETLLDEFKEKPETGTVDITIPEGYTIDEMIDLFVNSYGIGTREGFVDVIQNGEFDYWFIRELEENGINDGRIYRLEGYLFPDTYQFYKASSEYTVVNKMLKRFSQIFTKEYRAQCEVMGYTVDEIVTLASLIEKEAESPSIFFTVSSVFHNRLNTPWNFPKFESDATVAYVLSHEKGERTTVTAADLYLDTPYNTYLYEGFPPGPIANPSASAMLAALSPQTTDYYYFVAHKGTTKFSATKAEHDAYIAEIRQDPASAAQQVPEEIPEA